MNRQDNTLRLYRMNEEEKEREGRWVIDSMWLLILNIKDCRIQ